MIPRPAQYLLRFDDLCPTVSPAKWGRFLPMLAEFRIRPILAVVPDNQDPALDISTPDPEFWAQMRAMEVDGAAIGLHGYRHLCVTRGRSLVPLHGETEFAGVPEPTQRQWIRSGLEILRAQGLHPSVWVAPRHGFDRVTLRVLREQGIGLLSDGFARGPFLRGGITWIPQQLWEPDDRPEGLWTICLHPNTAPDSLVARLDAFLRRHAGQFTSVDRALAELTPATLGLSERVYSAATLLRIHCRRLLKRFRGRP